MNVFEFLGLQKNHRKSDKVVQYVKHMDEVPDSKKSWPMYGQTKKDGVYALVVVRYDGEVGIFSRTGKQYTNTELLVVDIKSYYPKAGVYKAELCCDACHLEALSGIVNPNRNRLLSLDQMKLRKEMYLAYHDATLIHEFIDGECDRDYEDRYQWLKDHLPKDFNRLVVSRINNQEEADKFVQEEIDEGEEGAVFKPLDAGWVAGHKGFRMMKKVRFVSYDLRCIRVEDGKGKMKGKVANLYFGWKNGKEIKCPLGKGWTHQDAEVMFKANKISDYWDTHADISGDIKDHLAVAASNPVGGIFEVYALQESSKGRLRLAKVGARRIDKDFSDMEVTDEGKS